MVPSNITFKLFSCGHIFFGKCLNNFILSLSIKVTATNEFWGKNKEEKKDHVPLSGHKQIDNGW
jgi:hypothetical protein